LHDDHGFRCCPGQDLLEAVRTHDLFLIALGDEALPDYILLCMIRWSKEMALIYRRET
jgi:hypothetical protein